MKRLLLLFVCLSCFFTGYSQSVEKKTDSANTGLSEYEFLKLEKCYSKMLASEAYTQFYKCQNVLVEKKNGLVTPDSLKDNKWMLDEGYTKKWLAANLKKTKFESVDEAYNLIWEHANLMIKFEEENPGVYELFYKASKEQQLEILNQESDYIMDH